MNEGKVTISIALMGFAILVLNYVLFGSGGKFFLIQDVGAATVSVSASVNTTVSCTPNISTTSLGVLTSGSVSTANPQATTSVSTNNPTGMTLRINGLNAGLINATSSYLINSTGTTLAAGTEGYGAQGTSSAGIVVVSAYNKTGNAVGAIPTSTQTLATSSATTSANVMTNILSAISNVTPAGSYSDTITFGCTAP